MFIEIAAGTFLLGQFIYHRWIKDKPQKRIPEREIQIPLVSDGAPVSMIYGRVRARAAILAWIDDPEFASAAYRMDALFAIGAPFVNGDSTNTIHGMWAGDKPFIWSPVGSRFSAICGDTSGGPSQGGAVEFLDGNPTQELVDSAGVAVNTTGQKMLDAGLAAEEIPGYRGLLCAFLHEFIGGLQWSLGASQSVPAYSFEVSSYTDDSSFPAPGILAQVGVDSNPVNALFDLVVHKVGVDASKIDMTSWQDAASTAYTEGNGYSRSIDDSAPLEEHMQSILEQLDAALDENPTTGKLRLKLIRNDFDPATVPHLTKENCSKLTNFSAGGWDLVVNRIRLTYTNRDDGYLDGSVLVHNQGNATSQVLDEEMALEYRGVHFESLARALATRELAARSRPIMKMRMLGDRSLMTLMRGDAVKVTWTNPDIAGLIFRVADVDRGTLEDGKVAIDLIQDYYYVWRNQIPQPPNLGDIDVDIPVVVNG